MVKNMKLSILVPAYNEEKNIQLFEKEVLPVMNDMEKKCNLVIELVLVNDGSTDNTLSSMQKLAKKDKRVRVISYTTNRNMGYALRFGIKHLDSDITVLMDSDLTFHPREIPKLLDVFNNNVDVVCGSPFMEGGKTENVPMYRRFLTDVVAFLYRIVLGKKVNSITPIFKLYRTSDLKDLELKSDGFTINAEILSKLIFKKRTVKEVPVTLTTRIHGESKMKFSKEIKNNLVMFFKILKWRF